MKNLIRNSHGTVVAAAMISLLVFMLAACDQVGPTQIQQMQRLEQTRSLFDFFPDQNFATIGFTNVVNMVNNPWARELFEMYPALRVWDSNLGVGIDRFDSFAIAFNEITGGDPEVLIIMKSDLNEEEILGLIGEKKQFFDEEFVGKRIQYTSGEDFSFGIINDELVALGSPSLVLESLKVANGEIKPLTSGDNLVRFEPYFAKQDDFWMAARDFDRLLKMEDAPTFIPRGFKTIDFVYFGFSAKDGVATQFIGEAEDADSAGKLARSLGMIKGIVKGLSQGIIQFREEADYSGLTSEELRQMFEEFVDNIDITHHERQVIIRFTFPDQLLDFFLELAKQTLDKEQMNGQVTDGIDSF
jgi:hypothetical protein